MKNLKLYSISILDVRVDIVTVGILSSIIKQTINNSQKIIIANVNVHAMNLANRISWFRNFLAKADVVFCDGAGVILGARLLGHRIPERITYADWMWSLSDLAANEGYKLFLLGSKQEVVETAANYLKKRYPKLEIVGVNNGFFNKEQNSQENEMVIQAINAAQPHILVVGFGMPLQERWLDQNWHRIDANIALTGGAVFDYVSGTLLRGPAWLTNNGMEWLARLVIEPRRLWKRYILGNPAFLWRITKARVRMILS